MPSPSARTITALWELAAEMELTAVELERLAVRARDLISVLEGGATLTGAMAEGPRPLIISKLTEITDRLHDAGSEVRRAEAHQLRAEGHTHERIAEMFGVSRQRAGALLRPVPADRRGPKRPRPQP